MVDYSAGEISTAEAAVLVAHIKKHLETDSLHFIRASVIAIA